MNRRQTIPKELRYTVEQFHKDFPNDDACLEFLKNKRFPDGVTYCEKCDKERKHYRVKGRTAYACDHCGNHIYPLAGTIFEKTTTSLRLWFYAMYLMGSTRCGISAKQIQRETGVTSKTAWRMFRQIRSLLSEPDMQLEGSTVEMDETYFGGKVRGVENKNTNKSTIVGIAKRGGSVVAKVTPDRSGQSLLGMVKERILPGSTVFTDEFTGYDGIVHLNAGYTHRRIHHSSKVYVMGDVHTNTIEGFWMLLKTGIKGVYHNVGKGYLQTYLDEYSFRYNRRDRGNLIFWAILERVCERVLAQPVQPSVQNQTV